MACARCWPDWPWACRRLRASRWLQAQVAGLAGPDPVVLLAVAVVLVATALLACLAPALRALRLPPALILRAE